MVVTARLVHRILHLSLDRLGGRPLACRQRRSSREGGEAVAKKKKAKKKKM